MSFRVFTSAALNYWPKVRVLFESVRVHHPEARLYLALADERPSHWQPPSWLAGVYTVDDLGLANPRGWAFGHSLVELATAIKPFVLERLLLEADEPVVYLDPDICVFRPLEEVLARLAQGAAVLLTPHLTAPETETAAILDNEMAALKHGTYNLGFVAVAPTESGRAFAAWWRDRCAQWCVDDIANGLFTDQRWCDLVPALFDDVAILRHPGYNAAPWNLGHRRIHCDDRGYWVKDDRGNVYPLVFYHFTGWNSGAHATMAARYGTESPGLAKLLHEYEAACRQWVEPSLEQRPWAFGHYRDGAPIARRDRRIYRARPDLQRAYPDPFAVSDNGKDYRGWLHTQGRLEYPDEEVPLIAHRSRRDKLRQALRHPSLIWHWLRLRGFRGL